MTIENVKNYIKDNLPEVCGKIQLAGINGNADEYIGVYPDNDRNNVFVAVGGLDNTYTDNLRCKIIVHWSTSIIDCGVMASKIFTLFYGKSNILIDGKKAYYCQPSNLVWQGRDNRGIHEYAINLNILFERR